MADLHKLLFETPAKISDREVLATARLNACVKAFAGRELADDVIDHINQAICDEADRLIAEGILRKRPDWLAAIGRPVPCASSKTWVCRLFGSDCGYYLRFMRGDQHASCENAWAPSDGHRSRPFRQ